MTPLLKHLTIGKIKSEKTQQTSDVALQPYKNIPTITYMLLERILNKKQQTHFVDVSVHFKQGVARLWLNCR